MSGQPTAREQPTYAVLASELDAISALAGSSVYVALVAGFFSGVAVLGFVAGDATRGALFTSAALILVYALFYVGRRHDMLVRNIKAACRPITVDGEAFNVAAAEGEVARG